MARDVSYSHIIACGGGIVETAEARKILINYKDSGGIVLSVHRDTIQVMNYLQIDKTRPAYQEDMMGVYLRRKSWYQECSNHHYIGQATKNDKAGLNDEFDAFTRFIALITGKARVLEGIVGKPRSFFVSLTGSDISGAQDIIRSATIGSDAVELRVDLLEDSAGTSTPSTLFVAQQVSMLRYITKMPIIFTIRTRSQGGRFPDTANAEATELYQLAVRMGVEFIDLEMQYPDNMLHQVCEQKGHSEIIASHHDAGGKLSWRNGSWVPFFNKALMYGDMVKLVGTAKTLNDNFDLEEFRSWASTYGIPLIAINMGSKGRISRALNKFMTPVSHPALPFKAAPGQLSAAEIRSILSNLGEIEREMFKLLGKPISTSPSPALHNTLFKQCGLPHEYSLLETNEVDTNVRDFLHSGDFGGASVTIPLKENIMDELDEVAKEAQIIGAVNTILPVQCGTVRKLVGYNTDWQGMVRCLQSACASRVPTLGRTSGIVIGGGGTERAAVFALHSMGCSPIYVVGRSSAKLTQMCASFPQDYSAQVLEDLAAAEALALGGDSVPTVAIGTVPGAYPIDPMLCRVIDCLFRGRKDGGEDGPQVLLEMAYRPSFTPLVRIADDGGWLTVPGRDVLSAQGIDQVCLPLNYTAYTLI
jgi:pentafunctional AROM polypeptide